MVKRGEIWWYEHPETGRRPHLVLTRDAAIPVLNQVLAAPATRTIRGIPTEVKLGPEDGMPEDCVLALDNLALIMPSLCTDRLASLGSERLLEVCRALRYATEC